MGTKVLEIMAQERILERAAAGGARLMSGLQASLGGSPFVGDLRGRGLMVGVEFVANKQTKAPLPRALNVAHWVALRALERGVIFYPGRGTVDGNRGDHILITPPLTSSDGEIDVIVDTLAACITDAERELSLERWSAESPVPGRWPD